MKKLYNKALMYQAFYMGKWALLLSSFIFGFVCYENINSNLRYLSHNISVFENNIYELQNYDIRLLSWALLLLMYIIITGISKRNNMIFLTCGPYTKSEIKKNEILFLFISLCAYIAVFCYITLCIYYRQSDLISLSHGFARETLKEIVKLFVCGIAFISYLSIMDSLFANIGITVFLMITSPFIIIFDLMFLEQILNHLKCTIIIDNPIIHFVFGIIRNIETFAFNNINYGPYNSYLLIAIVLTCTILLLILTKYTINKLTINNTNKFFNFPLVENIFLWCFSISVTIVISYFLINLYTHGLTWAYSENATFSIHGVIYIVLLIVSSYIVKQFVGKQLKKII